MFRYLALAWNDADPHQRETAERLSLSIEQDSSNWTKVVRTSGLRVYVNGRRAEADQIHVLERGQGVVVGTVFQRVNGHDSCGSDALAACGLKAESIVKSEGRALIHGYWGRYVAFVRNREVSKLWVIRDPSGHLPCFRTRYQGVNLYFSYIGDCLSLLPLTFSVNWDYVRARVVRPALASAETGLNEVTEVLAGQCHVIFGGEYSVKWYWHPKTFAIGNGVIDAHEAQEALRSTVFSTVDQWSSCYSGILHRVSGGLDSAIVLAALQRSKRSKVTCVTHHPNREASREDIDERVFARMATDKWRARLIEIERNGRVPLRPLLSMRRFPTPQIVPGRNVDLHRIEGRIARAAGATAIFNGEGGDIVFYQHPIESAVGDFVRHRSLQRDLLPLAMGVARNEGLSIWKVLSAAFSEKVGAAKWSPIGQHPSDDPFIPRELMMAAMMDERFVHPWFEDLADIPHGKLWHIYMMHVPRTCYPCIGDEEEPDYVEVLSSQPMLETCISIPTYMLAKDGRERGLARSAFAHEVPTQIIRRRSKGGITGFIKEVVLHNQQFVLDHLRHGILVRERLLDGQQLELAIRAAPDKENPGLGAVFDFLTLELWLQGWEERGLLQSGSQLRAAI